MRTTVIVTAAACSLALVSACGSSATSSSTATPTSTATGSASVSLALPAVADIKASSTTDQTVNMPKSGLDDSAIPLGGSTKTSTEAKAGYLYACRTPSGGPAVTIPPWVDTSASTWDATTKVAVEGADHYSNRTFTATENGTSLVLAGNRLPQQSGTFPVSALDPAHQYNPNPDSVTSGTMSATITLNPTVNTTATCNAGFSGIMSDGIPLLDGYDAGGYDAAAVETQDTCHGHPNSETGYHYHSLSPCILTATARTQSTQVGWAFDGFGIYVEYNADGTMLTNGALDACHGRTSVVTWHGKKQSIYHYVMTAEFPYAVGCFRGTPATTANVSGIGYIAP